MKVLQAHSSEKVAVFRCSSRSSRSSLRRAGGRGALGAAGLVLAWSSVTGAHINPEPGSVVAGSQVTVGFGVEHGCGESPTTKVEISLPAGISGATGVAKPGWTIDNGAKVVTFAGGELDAKTPETFELRFTAPSAAGDVYFPIVQTCTQGELAWITIAKEGDPEPDYPAPLLEVTAGPGAPTSVAVPDGSATSTTAHAHDDGDDHDHADEEAATVTTEAAARAASAETIEVTPVAEDGGSSTLPLVLGAGVGAAGIGAIVAFARRKR